jgi:hypothetical protein
MKKLLVVLMVLSMVSMANAALTINVDGLNPEDSVVNLLPSQTAMISLTGDGLTPGPTDLYLVSQGLGTISGGVRIYPGSMSEGPRAATEPELASLGAAGIQTSNALFMLFADGGDPPAPLAGLLVDEVLFHCDGQPGDVTLSLLNLTWVYNEETEGYDPVVTVYDTQVIHQIPEPFTMALLGLGGLFLRRRK